MALKALEQRLKTLTDIVFGGTTQADKTRKEYAEGSNICEINKAELVSSMMIAWDSYNPSGSKDNTVRTEVKEGMARFVADIIAGYRKNLPGYVGSNKLKAEIIISDDSRVRFRVDGSVSRADKFFRDFNNLETDKAVNKHLQLFTTGADSTRSSKFATKRKDGSYKVRVDLAHGEGMAIYNAKEALLKQTVDAASGRSQIGSAEDGSSDHLDLSKLPQEAIDASKKMQSNEKEWIIDASNLINVNLSNGKIVSNQEIVLTVQSQKQNKDDARASEGKVKRLKTELKEYQADIQKILKSKAKEDWGPGEYGSKSVLELIGETIVMSPIKQKAYKNKTGINKTQFKAVAKSQKQTNAKDSRKIKQPVFLIKGGGPSKQTKKPAGGNDSNERGNTRNPEEAGRTAATLLKYRAAMNKRLPARVKQNMTGNTLQNVSGRFANSARIEMMSPAAKTLMVKYTYRLNPYETFENTGQRRWPTGYNPKTLIAKSIRQLALEMMGEKLITTRRV